MCDFSLHAQREGPEYTALFKQSTEKILSTKKYTFILLALTENWENYDYADNCNSLEITTQRPLVPSETTCFVLLKTVSFPRILKSLAWKRLLSKLNHYHNLKHHPCLRWFNYLINICLDSMIGARFLLKGRFQ